MIHSGSCACGAVRIDAAGDPVTVSMCHCQKCQKQSGNTGCYITLQSCPSCASTLHWEVEAMPDMVGIPLGVCDDPAIPPPRTSILVPQKHPWIAVPEGMPQNDGHGAAFLDAARAALSARMPEDAP